MPIDVSDSTIVRAEYVFNRRLPGHVQVPYQAREAVRQGVEEGRDSVQLLTGSRHDVFTAGKVWVPLYVSNIPGASLW